MCEQELKKASIQPNIMIDCSHANSNKDAALQPLVLSNVTHQIIDGNTSIVGTMIESNLGWGNQKLSSDRAAMEYGVSVTDACIDWEATEKSLREMRDLLKDVLPGRQRG